MNFVYFLDSLGGFRIETFPPFAKTIGEYENKPKSNKKAFSILPKLSKNPFIGTLEFERSKIDKSKNICG